MPPMTDIGPRVAAAAPAVSSLTYTPPLDREFICYRVLILNPSANDTWNITVGGRTIMSLYELTVGNQQLAGGIYSGTYRSRDIWTWHHRTLGDYLSIPVPNGQSISVSSAGGATANVVIWGADVTRGSISPAQRNHYQGNQFRIPLYGYVNASVTGTAAQEVAVDTEVKPPWIRNIFLGNPLQATWRVTVLAMFLEAASVNTFSGAANHVSSTDHVAVIKNGQRLFSHVLSGQVSGGFSTITAVPAGQLVAPNGIPNFAAAAAAGSANTVYSQTSNVLPAFQVISEEPQSLIDPPLVINPGDEVQFLLGITGDATGGASYATAPIVLLADVQEVG